ncbi:reverse transcriptase domain-containing protein [Tanacetum coccineum]
MIKSSNGETSFSLTYGTEAVIPAEIGMPTLRTAKVDLTGNDEALEINLDLIEEKREQAAIQEAKSKAKMEKYYNSKVRDTSFKPGDMVYRNNDASHATDGGKLGPKWEGPYEVTEALGNGAYKLKDRKGNELPRTLGGETSACFLAPQNGLFQGRSSKAKTRIFDKAAKGSVIVGSCIRTSSHPSILLDFKNTYQGEIAAKEAISAVLMTEREGKQMSVYFVSRVLRGPEINYTPMEKLVLALLSASRRLKRYFQAHIIIVITDQPIKQLLSNSEITGRMLKWKFELEGYDIQYRPRISIKGQILADFIVERPEEESPDELMTEPEELPEPWTLFTDGSSCIDGSEAGLILTNPEGVECTYAMRFRFEATNNEAEYEALIVGLRIAEQLGVKNLQANVDSRLIANQEILPKDKKKARAVRRKASSYAVINGTLYKKSFLVPWLRCVRPLQANYVRKEIHEGSCSMYSGPRSVVAKALRTGYYWPTMHTDARKLIRECNDCQVHLPILRNSQHNLTPITSPWPFYKWGIDIVGPFSEGPSKVKFLIVAIDYFTKWIEAKPVATITSNQVKKLVWDNIVCRFGLPGEVVSDNGKQFRDNPFKDCLGEGIKARLDERSKDWIGELSHVLWAHRTMIKSSNGETPFSLTCGTEAVIPAEICMPTLRTAEVDLTGNGEALEINLDLIEEKR